MKVIIFGANGKTGQKVIEQALAAGMEVSAFVRTAQALTITAEKLNIIVGEATQYEAVKAAMIGQDAVISCIGGPGTKVSTIITDITKNITLAMNETGVKRIAVIASAGIHNELPGIAGKVISYLLKNTLNDHKGAFAALQASGVNYTVARPVSLTDGEGKGSYREAETGVPTRGMSIARADVANFLVKAIQDEHYSGKSVGLAY